MPDFLIKFVSNAIFSRQAPMIFLILIGFIKLADFTKLLNFFSFSLGFKSELPSVSDKLVVKLVRYFNYYTTP